MGPDQRAHPICSIRSPWQVVFKWNQEHGLRLFLENTPEASTWRPLPGAGAGFHVLEQSTRRFMYYGPSGNKTESLLTGWDGKRFNRPNDFMRRPGLESGQLEYWMTDPAILFRHRRWRQNSMGSLFFVSRTIGRRKRRDVVRAAGDQEFGPAKWYRVSKMVESCLWDSKQEPCFAM